MTWEVLWEAFMAQLAIGTRSRRLYDRVLALVLRFCAEQEISSPRAFEERHLDAFSRDLYARPGAPRSHHNRICCLRKVLQWAYKKGHLLIDSTADYRWKYPTSKTRKRLSRRQMETLIASPESDTLLGQRDGFLLELLYGTGLRVAECGGLQLEHLDLSRGQLRVEQGKGGKDRNLPIGPRLLALLDAYLRQVRPQFVIEPSVKAVFLNTKGRPMNCWGISTAIRQRAQKAGFPGITVHSIRHSFASHLLQNKAPLWAVQHLLGHESTVTTQVYTQLLDSELRATYFRTHPRGRRR